MPIFIFSFALLCLEDARMLLLGFGAIRSSVSFNLRQKRRASFAVESKWGKSIHYHWYASEKCSNSNIARLEIPSHLLSMHVYPRAVTSSQRETSQLPIEPTVWRRDLVPLSKIDAVMWPIIYDVRRVCRWVDLSECQPNGRWQRRVVSFLMSLFGFEIPNRRQYHISSPRFNHTRRFSHCTRCGFHGGRSYDCFEQKVLCRHFSFKRSTLSTSLHMCHLSCQYAWVLYIYSDKDMFCKTRRYNVHRSREEKNGLRLKPATGLFWNGS